MFCRRIFVFRKREIVKESANGAKPVSDIGCYDLGISVADTVFAAHMPYPEEKEKSETVSLK